VSGSQDTSLKLSNKNWHNAIDCQTIVGENLAVGEILQNFPVALLIG
jgi:(1->4)-alpha-D-glucan 1-alpha-D-glucosylmutase